MYELFMCGPPHFTGQELIGLKCCRGCNLQSMSTDKNDQSIKQLMTGGVGSVAGGTQDITSHEDSTASTDQQSLPCIKLKLFGNCRVGKTTLVDSLRCGYIHALFRQLSRTKQGQSQGQGHAEGQTELQDVEEGNITSDHEGCTRCIDVQHIHVSGT